MQTLTTAPNKIVNVPAGTTESRARFLFGTLDEDRRTSTTHVPSRARLVSYDSTTGRALVDYALGGCGSFATLEDVRVELDGVELPDGQVPSFVKAADGRSLPAILQVRDGAVVGVPSVFGKDTR